MFSLKALQKGVYVHGCLSPLTMIAHEVVLWCIPAYLDIEFPFCFLFELSTHENHQDLGKEKEKLVKREQSKLLLLHFLKGIIFLLGQISGFLLRLVQIHLVFECIVTLGTGTWGILEVFVFKH